MIKFIIGFFLGTMFALFLFGACMVASDYDDDCERLSK